MTFPRKHVSVVFVSLLLLLTACTSQPPVDPRHIGTVTEFSGFPSVIRNGKTYFLARQSQIFPGDIIRTNHDSRVNLNMIDDTRIILGNDSHFVFHEYQYSPGAFFPSARMSFTGGTFRARTENVTRAWFGAFEISTPLAAIHAETADFWVELSRAGNSLEVTMLEGDKIQIINDHGNVQIDQRRFGSTVLAGSAPRSPRRWSERKIESALDASGMHGYRRKP